MRYPTAMPAKVSYVRNRQRMQTRIRKEGGQDKCPSTPRSSACCQNQEARLGSDSHGNPLVDVCGYCHKIFLGGTPALASPAAELTWWILAIHSTLASDQPRAFWEGPCLLCNTTCCPLARSSSLIMKNKSLVSRVRHVKEEHKNPRQMPRTIRVK